MGCIAVGPQYSWHLPVPLATEFGYIFPNHRLEGTVQPLHYSVALWVTHCGIQPFNAEQLAHILYEVRQLICATIRKQSFWNSNYQHNLFHQKTSNPLMRKIKWPLCEKVLKDLINILVSVFGDG